MGAQKVKDADTLFKVCKIKGTEEYYNLGLNFRQSIANFALKLCGESYNFSWDSFQFIVDFKDEKQKLYEATFEVVFLLKENVVFALQGIKLSQYTYKTYL